MCGSFRLLNIVRIKEKKKLLNLIRIYLFIALLMEKLYKMQMMNWNEMNKLWNFFFKLRLNDNICWNCLRRNESPRHGTAVEFYVKWCVVLLVDCISNAHYFLVSSVVAFLTCDTSVTTFCNSRMVHLTSSTVIHSRFLNENAIIHLYSIKKKHQPKRCTIFYTLIKLWIKGH